MTQPNEKDEGSGVAAPDPDSPKSIPRQPRRLIKSEGNSVSSFKQRCQLFVKILVMSAAILYLHVGSAMAALLEPVPPGAFVEDDNPISLLVVIINYAEYKFEGIGKLLAVLSLSAYVLRGEIKECLNDIKDFFGKR